MATALIIGSLVQVRVWCVDSEQASVNSIWYSVAALGATPITDQDVSDTRDTTFAPLFKALLNNLASYHGVQVVVHSQIAPFGQLLAPVFTNANAGVGTRGAIALPRQVSGLISYQTILPGPAGRGRLYIPFPADADNQGGGAPGGTYITNALALASATNTGISITVGGRTGTLVRALVHKANKAGVFLQPTPVTGGTVSSKWATQRKRGTFGRANSSPI